MMLSEDELFLLRRDIAVELIQQYGANAVTNPKAVVEALDEITKAVADIQGPRIEGQR